MYINRHYMSNWSVGLDFYKIYSSPVGEHQASVFQIGLLFFNITFTRWQEPQWT